MRTPPGPNLKRSPGSLTAVVTLLVLGISLLAAPAPAQAAQRTSSGRIHVSALAVAETNQGFVGVHSDVYATVLAGGSGQVFVSTRPLAQTDMQGSARLASQVAANTLGLDWHAYDFLVEMESDSAIIGGPSAGGEMTLALTTALHNLQSPADPWTLDSHVAGTGTINPDGTIGPVGGVPSKAEAAAASGVTTFLYPAGLDIAPTLVAGRFGPQQISVKMSDKCAELQMTCRAVSSITEILEAAAHIHFTTSTPVQASSKDYSDILGPAAKSQVQHLDALLQTLQADDLHGLTPSGKTHVQHSITTAKDGLASAQTALDGEQFYLASTRAFRAEIEADYAQNATQLLRTGELDVAQRAVDACKSQAQAAAAASDALPTKGVTALLGVAAAQQRAQEAVALGEQADQELQAAGSTNGVLAALKDAVFCSARAGTATWWGQLSSAFGTGPAVGDLKGLADDAVQQAREMVTYAEAVQGGAQLSGPEQALANAQEHVKAQRWPAAILEAVDAQTQASIAVQAANGAPVSASVIDAAREGAQRAVAQARSRGVEPVISVSLLELSTEQGNDTADALQSLWSARSMALVGSLPVAAPVTAVANGGNTAGPGVAGEDATGVGGAGAGNAVGTTSNPAAAVVMIVLVLLVIVSTIAACIVAFVRKG